MTGAPPFPPKTNPLLLDSPDEESGTGADADADADAGAGTGAPNVIGAGAGVDAVAAKSAPLKEKEVALFDGLGVCSVV